MKGIILAGGSGSRLYPVTKSVSKQLLSIYDKPMIYYPLSTLMMAGIKNILIISTPHDIENYKKLLGNGKNLGIQLEYLIQPKPEGLAQAFIIGEEFIGNDNVALVLGDNIFYGEKFQKLLTNSIEILNKFNSAMIFGYKVEDPERFGIVEFDKKLNVLSIEEKPQIPKSNYAVVGLYFYPNSVVEISKNIKPSNRGELEITSVNKEYLKKNNLIVQLLKDDFKWLDTGTHETLLEASNFVYKTEKMFNCKIGCIEEISLKKNFINKEKFSKLTLDFKKNEYSDYLINLLTNENSENTN